MDDMYNSDRKQRFMAERNEEVILPKGYLERWFKKISKFEFEINKDVCDFTFYEIVNMYKTFSLNSVEVLRVLNSQLSIYSQWCINNNLVRDSQNHFVEIKKEIFEKCINILAIKNKLFTREQVLEWARELKNPSDSFLFLALFEGIRGKLNCELVNLKISDFHDGKVTLCTGREIEVSNDLYNFALEANETTQYYGVSNDITYKLLPDDLIFKNYPNVKDDASDAVCASKRIANKLSRNAKYLGLETMLTANILRESGKIYFIKKRCNELGIDYIEYFRDYGYEVEKQYDCHIISPNVAYQKYKEYLD